MHACLSSLCRSTQASSPHALLLSTHIEDLRENQHVLGLLHPSSVAQLEALALRPLQENFLRSEQLQLFLELRQTLDKVPEKQDERPMEAIKTFADILRSALLAPGAYLSCKRPWTLSERVVLSLMAPSAVPCTQESTDLLEGLVREQLRARSGDRGSLLHAQCNVRFMRVVAGHAPGQESTMDALEACEEHLRFASLRAESNSNCTLSAKEKSRDREDLVRVVGLYASLSLGEGSLQDALALRLGLLLRDYIARFGGAPAAEVVLSFLPWEPGWLGRRKGKRNTHTHRGASWRARWSWRWPSRCTPPVRSGLPWETKSTTPFFLRDEDSVLARLFSSPCSREEDFEEVKEVIEAMCLLGRRERARELAASAERVLDQRFLRGLVAFLGRLDFSLRGQGGGVGGAKGEL